MEPFTLILIFLASMFALASFVQVSGLYDISRGIRQAIQKDKDVYTKGKDAYQAAIDAKLTAGEASNNQRNTMKMAYREKYPEATDKEVEDAVNAILELNMSPDDLLQFIKDETAFLAEQGNNEEVDKLQKQIEELQKQRPPVGDPGAGGGGGGGGDTGSGGGDPGTGWGSPLPLPPPQDLLHPPGTSVVLGNGAEVGQPCRAPRYNDEPCNDILGLVCDSTTLQCIDKVNLKQGFPCSKNTQCESGKCSNNKCLAPAGSVGTNPNEYCTDTSECATGAGFTTVCGDNKCKSTTTGSSGSGTGSPGSGTGSPGSGTGSPGSGTGSSGSVGTTTTTPAPSRIGTIGPDVGCVPLVNEYLQSECIDGYICSKSSKQSTEPPTCRRMGAGNAQEGSRCLEHIDCFGGGEIFLCDRTDKKCKKLPIVGSGAVCGPYAGKCAAGLCCNGHCGTADMFCNNRSQLAYETSRPVVASTTPPSYEGRCGTADGRIPKQKCGPNLPYCSSAGWCGSSTDHQNGQTEFNYVPPDAPASTKKANGIECNTNSDCISDNCYGYGRARKTCENKSNILGDCGIESNCMDGLKCESNKCKYKEYQVCSSSSQCSTGFECRGDTTGNQTKCLQPLEIQKIVTGGSCTTDNNCASNKCIAGKCVPGDTLTSCPGYKCTTLGQTCLQANDSNKKYVCEKKDVPGNCISTSNHWTTVALYSPGGCWIRKEGYTPPKPEFGRQKKYELAYKSKK
jgi:hypothetical protein